MGKDLKGKELGTGISQRPDGNYMARFVDRYKKRHTLYDRDLKALKDATNPSCRQGREPR